MHALNEPVQTAPPGFSFRDLLRHPNRIVGIGLVLITALSWYYLIRMEREMYGGMPDMPGCMMNMSGPWTLDFFWMTFGMWSVMMVAMMTPTVVPMVLTYDLVSRRRAGDQMLSLPTWMFLGGYLAAWTAFSLVATFFQWALHNAALLVPASLSVAPWLGGLLLVFAGVYQFTPWKNSCLRKCASPLEFLIAEWRYGAAGAFHMGARHGVFCTGCCALLMALLFVAGVMNLLWIAVLAAAALLEKLAPAGRLTSRALGIILIFAGIGLASYPLWRL
ncbi:MAG: DUF2182 domain-containing protein [Acidobacteria bacterium]|nr:DUF2182 domain-containing protein [Acidobacteriota bacterium]